MKSPRRFASSVVLPSGKLLVTGGGTNSDQLDTTEIFDIQKGWETYTNLPVTMSRHCTVLSKKGSRSNRIQFF